MDNKKIIEALSQLIHKHDDAILAYYQAIENIDIAEVNTMLTEFMEEHKRSINTISNLIQSLNTYTPGVTSHLESRPLESFATTHLASGIEGALNSLYSNEKSNRHACLALLGYKLPVEMQALIENNYNEEKKHIGFIEHLLENKPWKKVEAPTS